MADAHADPNAQLEDPESTPADLMTQRMEDLVQEYLDCPLAQKEPEQERLAKKWQEQVAEKVDQLFEELQGEEDRLALFGFFPQNLTKRRIVEVLGIERKLDRNAIARNMRSVVPQMGSNNTEAKKCGDFIDMDEKRQALLHIHESLRAIQDPDNYWQQEAQDVLIALLSTFGPDSQETKIKLDLEELAARCVLSHFRLSMRMGQRPESWVFDRVCTLEPVVALRGSRNSDHTLLHELLRDIFAEGQCQKYMTFYVKNKELVEQKWGLSNTELLQKVRTLTLCTLCVRSTEALRKGDTAIVTYQKIANQLCINSEDVERYVIEARSLGLLNAKIDACEQAIVVKSAHHAFFARDDWRRLREKLNLWREATDKLMIILDEVRMQQVKEDKEQERMEAREIDRAV